MRKIKGFTLIELLVVIAIIGILSAIVLASLNTARGKAANAAIKEDLSGLRSQAEIYHSDNNNSYYVASGDTVCENQKIVDILTHASASAGLVYPDGTFCYADSTAGTYVAVAQLRIAEGSGADQTHWCVDSEGAAKTLTAIPAPTDTPVACP